MASRRARSKDPKGVIWCVLDVGSLRITVWLVDRRSDPDLKDTAAGYFDALRSVILIADDLTSEHAEATLVHELTHFAVYAFGADPMAAHVVGDRTDAEEGAVNSFSAIIFDTLKRNGMLVFPAMPARRAA